MTATPLRLRRRIDLGSRTPPPIYAIGDIHGCLDELKEAEAGIAADMQACKRPGIVVLLGDYIDRGPSSRAVIEYLIRPSELGLKRLPLCGNHDDIFHRFLQNPQTYQDWFTIGGERTLLSYGIDIQHLITRQKVRGDKLQELLAQAIPASHRQFLQRLPVSFSIGDMVFVHAGLRPGIPLKDQDDNDLMWIRDPFLAQGPELPLLVIHGHTPTTDAEFGRNRIGIDTGAYYTGKLSVLKITDGSATIL